MMYSILLPIKKKNLKKRKKKERKNNHNNNILLVVSKLPHFELPLNEHNKINKLIKVNKIK